MLSKQEIELRNASMSFANKLRVFEIIWKNLAINDSSKTLVILEKRIKYKLLRLLRIAIVIIINSDKKTSNDSAFNEIFVNLFIFTKRSKTKEIKEVKNCKCYFIDIDLLKRINCELRNKIKMRIENKCLFTIYLLIKLTLTKNFSNLYYIYTCKIFKYIKFNFNDIRHKIILKRLKIC